MSAIIETKPAVFPSNLKNHIGGREETISQTFTMAYRALIRLRPHAGAVGGRAHRAVHLHVHVRLPLRRARSPAGCRAYLPVLIPAILVQSVVQASVVTGTQLREDMDTGVFDRFRSLPMARIAPLAGALITDMIRYAVIAVLTIAVGCLIGWRPGGGFGIVVGALLVIVTAWAISWIWALLGTVARTAGTVQGIAMIIMMPLHVPVETRSSRRARSPTGSRWSRTATRSRTLITAIRDLMNNGHFGWDFLWTLVGAVVIVAIFAPLTVRAYMRKA